MARTKSTPRLLKRSLAEIAEETIKESSECSALGFKAFEVVIHSTPEHHSQFEKCDLREPDEEVTFADPRPWESAACPAIRAKAKQAFQGGSSAQDFYEKVLCKSEDECKADTEYPQRSVGWLNARTFSITGSDFASAVSRNPYKSSKKLLAGKVAPSKDGFSSKYAQWGVDHEVHAEEAFTAVLDERCKSPFIIQHPHMFKHVQAQWIAVSPDGVLTHRDESGATVVDLVEYKAPAYYRDARHFPYRKFETNGNIPPQYYDQIQGTLWLMRNYDVFPGGRTVRGCYFVVWQPHALSVVYIPYKEAYANALAAKLKDFYFDRFIPKCIEELNSN
jgi:putative phage-type endonuclease